MNAYGHTQLYPGSDHRWWVWCADCRDAVRERGQRVQVHKRSAAQARARAHEQLHELRELQREVAA